MTAINDDDDNQQFPFEMSDYDDVDDFDSDDSASVD